MIGINSNLDYLYGPMGASGNPTARPLAARPATTPKPMMFGANSMLWPYLMSFGSGMLTAPPGSDLGQSVGRGLASGNQALQTYPLRSLQMEALKEKVAASRAKRLSGVASAPKTRTRVEGNKKIVEEWDGLRWKKVSEGPRYKPGGVSITSPLVTNTYTPLPKGAQAGVAKKVLGLDDTLNRMDHIASLYRPEFSTYKAQGQAWLERQREKLGAGGDNKFLADYSAWKSQSQQFFNEYRKQITGVAAGEREMEWIKESIPNVDDSPTEYQSKLRQLVEINKQIRERYFNALKSGLKPGTPEFRKYLEANPLKRPAPAADLYKKYNLER